MLHSTELRCTLSELCCTLRATLSSELSCFLLSYAAPYWAMPHPKWATQHPKNIMCPVYRSFADPSYKINDCATEAIFCCPTESSHHLKSWILSKDAAFHNEKESRRTWPRSQVSLEKSSKNYSRWENEPNQTSCKRPPPPPAKSNGEYFQRVFHVATPDPPNSPVVATRHSEWQLLGARAGWSAVWYNSLTGW